MCEKKLWQHQGQRRCGKEVLTELEKSFSPEPVVKTVVTHVDPLQLMDAHSGRDIHTVICEAFSHERKLQQGKPKLEEDAERACGPWTKAPMQKQDFCKDLQPYGISIYEHSVPWQTVSHGKDPCSTSSWRKAACGKDPCWGILWEESQAGAGRKCEEEGVSERRYLTTFLFPISLPWSGGRWYIEKLWVKVCLGKREMWV